ncbi:hypothetical protein ASPFODRAFT_238344 [Aspergillus luchuensis CBS 106.47]|uniref:Uncharacterized protein n=1 Tax=Aspergillus luchuensis (strain CBS 106.47) TaxID=1137211 RepID=A0A1M3TYR9_ASPLC|nr:hypothetical protein ASPFODRAFT_238344 [Aspergillus luchuensis CBS 106.47]
MIVANSCEDAVLGLGGEKWRPLVRASGTLTKKPLISGPKVWQRKATREARRCHPLCLPTWHLLFFLTMMDAAMCWRLAASRCSSPCDRTGVRLQWSVSRLFTSPVPPLSYLF